MALLTACATTPAGRTAPAGIDLSGRWELDAAASDTTEAALARVRSELEPPLRRRDPRLVGDEPPLAPPIGDRFGPPRTRELAALLDQPAAFDLVQGPAGITLRSENGTREYGFGGRSVVSVVDGLADQYSGWLGRQFGITLRATDGRRIQHVFGVVDGRLGLTTRVSGGGLPDVAMTRIYRRSGPPANRGP